MITIQGTPAGGSPATAEWLSLLNARNQNNKSTNASLNGDGSHDWNNEGETELGKNTTE